MSLVKRGRAREAVQQFEMLREVAPNYADVRFHLGILYRERGDLDPAAEELAAAMAANPRYTRAALVLAEVRLDQERWVEARAAFERVLADGLDGATIRTRLALVYEKLGENESAEACHGRAVELAPDDPDALRARAEWLERHGRKADAKVDRARLDVLLRSGFGKKGGKEELPEAA